MNDGPGSWNRRSVYAKASLELVGRRICSVNALAHLGGHQQKYNIRAHMPKKKALDLSLEKQRTSGANISCHSYYILKGLHFRGHVKNWQFSSNGNYYTNS